MTLFVHVTAPNGTSRTKLEDKAEFIARHTLSAQRQGKARWKGIRIRISVCDLDQDWMRRQLCRTGEEFEGFKEP